MKKTLPLALSLIVVLASCADLPTENPPPLDEIGPSFSLTSGEVDVGMQDLHPPDGGVRSTAVAVNSLGEVIVVSQAGWHLWHDGPFRFLAGLSDKPFLLVNDLNDAGLAVGKYEPVNNIRHTFTYDIHTGEFTDVGLGPFGLTAEANNVNNNGRITGRGAFNFVNESGFTRDPGGPIVALPRLPDRERCQGWESNESNLIVGLCIVDSHTLEAVVWVGGLPARLPDFGNLGSRALAVNSSGQIAGMARRLFDGRVQRRTVVWPDLNTTPVPLSGIFANNIVGLSDDGQVAGTGRLDVTFEQVSFIWRDGAVVPLSDFAGTHFTGAFDQSATGIVAGRAWNPVVRQHHATIWTFSVRTPAEILQSMLDDILADPDLNVGVAASLASKLENVIAKLDKGNVGAAINQLQAFINQIQALIQAGTLDQPDGELLIDVAQGVIDRLSA